MGQAFQELCDREARCFLPAVRRQPLALVSGRGARVRDIEGNEFVDLTAGWGVTAIGHSHPALVEAIAAQAGRLMQTTNAFYSAPQLELAEALLARAPRVMTRCFFLSSGAEANEGAIKLAHRATGRSRFLSASGAFHGRTLGALGLMDAGAYRTPFAALLPEPRTVPFGDLEALRRRLDRETAAVILEPIQGEAGVQVPPPGYLRGVRALCDEAGALLVLDEVQTGIGRTGRWFACEHEGVAPDIATLGKGLGGGFPIAAFLCSEAVAKTVTPGEHGGTYAGNLLACAAAAAVLRVVAEEGLVDRAEALGAALLDRLAAFAAQHPEQVAEVRGRGLLVGLELRDAAHAAAVVRRLLAQGVLINRTAGSVLRFFPPLNIGEGELFSAVDRVLALCADRAAES